MTVHLVAQHRLGFGAPAPASTRARDYVVDRRDLRVTSPYDLCILASLAGVLGERMGAEDHRDDLAMFLAGSKKTIPGLSEEWAANGTLSPHAWNDRTRRPEMLRKLNLSIHPFYVISALPNLAMHLASKSFGISGSMDQYICEPWADVAALLMATIAVESGSSTEALIASAYVSATVEGAAMAEGEPLRSLPPLDDNQGGVAWRIGIGARRDRPRVQLPLLRAGLAADESICVAANWAASTCGPIHVLGGEPFVERLAAQLPGRDVVARKMTNHPMPTLATLTTLIDDGAAAAAVVVDHGDAVTGAAVDAP